MLLTRSAGRSPSGRVDTTSVNFGDNSMKTLVRLIKDESAATAIEYCLIASLISIVIVVAVNGVGSTLNTTYTSVGNALK
jgi:pilus assembly protein Flp/PilA